MKKFAYITLLFVPLFFSSYASASEVNIYSYRQPFLIEPLTTAFTNKTGIKVNTVYLRKGMIERMKAEGKRSPADVVLTVDISRLSALVEAELTQQVKNGEIVKYEELADPKWKGRICIRSGLNAYNLALTSAIIHHHGEDYAIEWLKGLKKNLARKPQGNDRAQVKAIWAGECDLSIGNTYYMGKMLKDPEQTDWAKSVNIVFPTFENGGTHVNVSGIGMARFSPNKDNALKLMEFLSSGEAQEIYATANFEYPIAPGTQVDNLVKSWGDFDADAVNLMTIAKLRKRALELTEIVDFDG